jgi:hypothetical protein
VPDLNSRFRYEDRLRVALLAIMKAQQARILQNPVDPSWGAFAAEIRQTVSRHLVAVYVEAAEQLGGEFGGVDGKDLEATAQAWAEGQAGEIATTFVAKAMTEIDKAVNEKRSREALLLVLLLLMAGDQADKIAVTEVTRAITAGERYVVGNNPPGSEYDMETGILTRPIWVTSQDERVCTVCRPLDGTTEEVWSETAPGGPPAHPRCRCYLLWKSAG